MSDKEQDTSDNAVVFPAKWDKVLKEIPEFKEIADAASEEDLKKILVMSEGNIFTIEKEKANDHKLNGARDCVKEFSEPYRSAIKVQTAKIKYALFLLEGRGANLDNTEE